MTQTNTTQKGIKKNFLNLDELKQLKECLPLLRHMQRNFRYMASLKPDYREPKYVDCFLHESGASIHEDVGLVKFIEIETEQL